MAKFTFLELHLDGSTFNAPFSKSGGEGDEDGSIEFGEEEEESSRSGSWKPALVGFLFLALIAAVAKKKLGGSAELDGIDKIEE